MLREMTNESVFPRSLHTATRQLSQLLSSQPTAIITADCYHHNQLLSSQPTAIITANCYHHSQLLSSQPTAIITANITADCYRHSQHHSQLLSSQPTSQPTAIVTANITANCYRHSQLLSSQPTAIVTANCYRHSQHHSQLLSSQPTAIVTANCYRHSQLSSRTTHSEGTFQCSECKKRFHKECLKDPVVTPLAADAFYYFTCCHCAPDGAEQYTRARISWQEILILCLYNLQLGGGGKRGYFRWKEHICAFVDKHWILLFGPHKKKKPTWHGTVAGAVSAGCPRHFVSGTAELGESGWWKLAVMKPPTYNADPPAKLVRRQRRNHGLGPLPMLEEEGGPSSGRSRRSKTFSLSAATELKAKRSTITDNPNKKRKTMAEMTKLLAEAKPAEIVSSQQDLHMEVDQVADTSCSSSTMSTSALSATNTSSLSTTSISSASEGNEAPSPKRYTASATGMCIPQETLLSGPFQLLPVKLMKHSGSKVTAMPPAFRVVKLVAQGSPSDAPPESSSCSASQSVNPEMVAIKQEECIAIQWDVAAEEKVHVSSASNELLGPVDSDDDVSLDNFNQNMSAETMGMTFEPCHSPDMVDLVMSMPDESETKPPLHLSTPLQDTAHSPQLPTSSYDHTYHPTEADKHPPQNPVPEDPNTDSEGPSEGEEELGGRSEEEDEEDEDEEEEEEEEEEREVERDASVTVLSAPVRTWRYRKGSRRRKRVEELEEEDPSRNLRMMTPYDEKWMLERLEAMMKMQPRSANGEPLEPWRAEQLCHQRNMLRRKLIVRKQRKLIVRKLQRENGIPVFDIDTIMARLREKYHGIKPEKKEEVQVKASASSHPHTISSRTLDRFMRKKGKASVEVQHSSFHTRLVGFEDHQLESIISPYTMRLLKPFIWRDTETVPLKVKLLQEIVQYPHRNDPTWSPPPAASLDYCYVRPQHIPSVNALCSAFFWPGIDLSECLQYPDFSCVAVYRKLVVGFAFLVPDVKHNEAYISFVFTRPDWRGAGIATFMLYHLCQTCMGKDITLHVSATNPAMLLYQKFGFKAEELCLDFYDKYFPAGAKECKHAFFLRLR
ncbi:hypothetical protein ACOMHN_017658 [Nucella lapillus]